MAYFFTAGEIGFYDGAIKDVYEMAGTWPGDAREISDAEHAIYSGQPPQGKVLGAENGLPVWVDAPPLTQQEQVLLAESKRTVSRSEADTAIAPLQDALDLEMATDEEKAKLNAWKKYRVLLSRIDTSTAPDINWPVSPA